MKKIGFIGVGMMGKPMVRNLLKAGFEVHVYARKKEKIQDVLQEGAIFHESIKSCVEHMEVIITIVGFPKDVEEVYFDSGNILDSAQKGAFLIDMTTTSPQLAKAIYEEGESRGYHVLDAPVTGGQIGAIQGTLSIMVGGMQKDFEACEEIFQAMGTNVNYQGLAGSGQHCKMVNQIMIAGIIAGVCEALQYAKGKKLDLEAVLAAVTTGSASSTQLQIFGPKILVNDYTPGFFLKHFVKDMELAYKEANLSGMHLNMLHQVLENYKDLEKAGYGDLGTQALIKYYNQNS